MHILRKCTSLVARGQPANFESLQQGVAVIIRLKSESTNVMIDADVCGLQTPFKIGMNYNTVVTLPNADGINYWIKEKFWTALLTIMIFIQKAAVIVMILL